MKMAVQHFHVLKLFWQVEVKFCKFGGEKTFISAERRPRKLKGQHNFGLC